MSKRNKNLDILKYIGKEAHKRGLEFQIAIWTQKYDFDDGYIISVFVSLKYSLPPSGRKGSSLKVELMNLPLISCLLSPFWILPEEINFSPVVHETINIKENINKIFLTLNTNKKYS